jgi:hypothetical protein
MSEDFMSGCFKGHTNLYVVGVFVSLFLFQSAEAQRRAMGGLRPGNVSPARLLVVDKVQIDLKLSDEQKSKGAEINERLTAGRHNLFAEVKKGDGKRAAKLGKLDQKAQASINELLDDTQEKRLQELLLQVNGASELFKKEIRGALDITKEQQTRLAEVRQANAKARQDALTGYEGDRMAKLIDLQREADAGLLEVLTAEQRKKLEEMKGKPIKIDLFAS